MEKANDFLLFSLLFFRFIIAKLIFFLIGLALAYAWVDIDVDLTFY